MILETLHSLSLCLEILYGKKLLYLLQHIAHFIALYTNNDYISETLGEDNW